MPTPQAAKYRLTARESQILELVAVGLTNRKTASLLHISERTVRNHLHSVFGKLGVHSRTEAAMVAVRENLLAAEGSSEAAIFQDRDAVAGVRKPEARK
ncbi:response regulator transcription factor [Actinomadura fulvescens]